MGSVCKGWEWEFAHGDTENNPRPVPNINKINDSAAAAAAPANMAPHDTALAVAFELAGPENLISSLVTTLEKSHNASKKLILYVIVELEEFC